MEKKAINTPGGHFDNLILQKKEGGKDSTFWSQEKTPRVKQEGPRTDNSGRGIKITNPIHRKGSDRTIA